jgi:hypothetical protein
MRNLLTTLGLCFVVHAAVAQCVYDAPGHAAHTGPVGDFIQAPTSAGDASLRNTAPDKLIRTSTQDGAGIPQASAWRTGRDATRGDRPRRSHAGGAMLLTALAVMSAIAWRRIAGPDR